MLDAIFLEKAGVPAVPIVTDAFESTAVEMAKLWGAPDFQFVMMPHPLFELTPDGVDRRADELVDRVLRLLQTGQQNTTDRDSNPVECDTAGIGTASEPKAADQIEYCFDHGWTDGLPVVPPTRELVEAMLRASGLGASTVIAQMASRKAAITAENVAINAVMAGCKPEYMPVVIAAVKGLAAPEFDLHHVAAGHSGATIITLVNGPIARKIGINATNNVFGHGTRANATIGRALRLVLHNCLNYKPGVADRSTMGTPGKFTCCIAENEEHHPWEPWHVERGFKPSDSTVTLVAASTMIQIRNHGDHKQVLRSVADALAFLGSIAFNVRAPGAVVLCGEHAELLRASGWSKKQVREFVIQHTGRTVADLKRAGQIPGEVVADDETTLRYAMDAPDELMVLCAGGPIGVISMVLPGFSGSRDAGRSPPILIETSD